MIDVYGFKPNGDLEFKDYSLLKIKGLLVPLSNYQYFPKIGVSLSFWSPQNYQISESSLKSYLIQYYKEYGVDIDTLDITQGAESITSMNMIFKLNNGLAEVLNGLQQ